MPPQGVELIRHEDILRFEEIAQLVDAAVRLGIDKVRITGGEPLVRKGVLGFVGMLSKITGIKDLSMTTNGILLQQFARPLADAGLQRVNISLDTIDPEKYRSITRVGNLANVIRGIEAARDAGLFPIKINCVVQQSSDEPDAVQVAEYGRKNGLQVRFIREMDLVKGTFTQVEGGDGGNCAICNRLRLTANGRIKPCLFSDLEYDVRKIGYEEAIRLAVAHKPLSGTVNKVNRFCNIGG
jgi:cyclic pyranopterin phosphate synthase